MRPPPAIDDASQRAFQLLHELLANTVAQVGVIANGRVSSFEDILGGIRIGIQDLTRLLFGIRNDLANPLLLDFDPVFLLLDQAIDGRNWKGRLGGWRRRRSRRLLIQSARHHLAPCLVLAFEILTQRLLLESAGAELLDNLQTAFGFNVVGVKFLGLFQQILGCLPVVAGDRPFGLGMQIGANNLALLVSVGQCAIGPNQCGLVFAVLPLFESAHQEEVVHLRSGKLFSFFDLDRLFTQPSLNHIGDTGAALDLADHQRRGISAKGRQHGRKRFNDRTSQLERGGIKNRSGQAGMYVASKFVNLVFADPRMNCATGAGCQPVQIWLHRRAGPRGTPTNSISLATNRAAASLERSAAEIGLCMLMPSPRKRMACRTVRGAPVEAGGLPASGHP